MDKIEKFEYVVLSNSDDDKRIDEQLSVFETLPKFVHWYCNNKVYSIENELKIIAQLLEKEDLIAVIEAPFSPEFNTAYIINGKGEVVMNISSLFEGKYSSVFYNKPVIFWDVYYIDRTLNFLLTSNNTDFRIEIDSRNGLIGDLIESR